MVCSLYNWNSPTDVSFNVANQSKHHNVRKHYRKPSGPGVATLTVLCDLKRNDDLCNPHKLFTNCTCYIWTGRNGDNREVLSSLVERDTMQLCCPDFSKLLTYMDTKSLLATFIASEPFSCSRWACEERKWKIIFAHRLRMAFIPFL